MGMRTYEDLKGMLCDELEEIVKKGAISAGDLDAVHKLTDTIKNVDKIEMFEEYDGYSERGGNWDATGSYSRGNRMYSYDDDMSMRNSYARGGRHYVRGHYSRAEGNQMMADQLEDMLMDSNMSATDKDTLRRALNIIRK